MSSARPRPTGASAAAPGTPRSTPMRQGSSSRLSASVNSANGTTGLKPATKIGTNPSGTTPAKRVSMATTTPAASPGRGAAKTSKTPSPVKGRNSKSPDRKGATARTTTPDAADTAPVATPEPAAGMGKPRLSLLRFNRDNPSSTPQQHQPQQPHQSPTLAADVASNNASDFNHSGGGDNAGGYFLSATDVDGEAPFASAFSGSYEPTSGGGDDEAGIPGAAGSYAPSGDGSSPPPSAAGGSASGTKGWAIMKDYYKSQKFHQRRPSTAAAVPLQGSPSLIGAQSRSTFGTGGPNAQSNGSFSVALFGTKSQNYFGRGLQSVASEGGSKEGGFPSPGQQGGLGEEDSHLRMILEETEAQLTEARSNAESAQFRVSFLEGEQSRLQHQIQTLRGDVKKLQADIFDLTSSKAHYSKQVDDLVEEKEELQLQLIGAGLVEKKAMQDMQVEMIDMQATVERTTATLVKKDQLISNILNENEKLKRGKTEQREADSKHGDVQVRLHIAEKGKAILQDKYDKETALLAARDEEIFNLNAEIDHLNAAIERISKKTRRAGLGGAFAKALDIETPTNKKPPHSPTRHRGMSTLDGSWRGGGSSSLGNTINGGLNSTIALLDEVEHEGDDYDEAIGKYLRVIRIDRALEGFKIEREGLQALLTEGMASFQELFNAHRVMQAISYDDAKKATELMIKEEARLKTMGPAASSYSNTRRQTPSARRHASPSKSPRGHQPPQQQPTQTESVDTAPPQSLNDSLVNISITSATARSNGASPHKAPVASSSAPVFDLEVSESAASTSALHAPPASSSMHLSPLQQRIARARSGSISQLGTSGLGASWNSAQPVPQGSSIRSTPASTHTPNGPRSPQQASLGGGTPITTTMAPPPATTATTSKLSNRGASPRVQDDHTAFLQHHHQGEGCVGAHRKCYVTSWYCAAGKDMLESWLTSMNLYSPALVNQLYNAGFVDMQALSKMTEKDMSDLQIVHGIRRKLLAGVEGLRDKLRVVTDETLRMLRNSYYLSDDSYEDHRHARSASVAHTDLEPTDDENEEVLDEGRLRERRQRRHVQRVARARDHLMQLQKRFSTQQRQLSLLSGTGFIPSFSDGEPKESLPAGQVSEVADPQEYHTRAVASEAPMVLDVMLQEMQSWFADIRLAIEAQEGAVERILQSFDDEEGNEK